MIQTNHPLGTIIKKTCSEAKNLVLEEFQMEDRKVGTLKKVRWHWREANEYNS
jgi:hypothetical protein